MIARLDADGIQTARYLPCIHLQPYMQQRFGFEAGLCPVAEELSSRTLALPFHARLGRDDQEYVAAALDSALTSAAAIQPLRAAANTSHAVVLSRANILEYWPSLRPRPARFSAANHDRIYGGKH